MVNRAVSRSLSPAKRLVGAPPPDRRAGRELELRLEDARHAVMPRVGRPLNLARQMSALTSDMPGVVGRPDPMRSRNECVAGMDRPR
jgi:hypothetical protein